MRTAIKAAGLLGATMLGPAPFTPAAAQSIVTRVSQNGSNSGNCFAAPCRTFAYAFSQTDTNGRIVCIDSGLYGNVTINRSVTIDCSGTNSIAGDGNGGDAIVIDDNATVSPGTINVTIRGLTVEGYTQSRYGISFQSGFALTVENVTINGFSGTLNGPGASGIRFVPNRAARLYVADSLISNNGAQGGSGIRVAPTGAGYAGVVLEDVRIVGNLTGLTVSTASSTASSSTNVVISRGSIASSAGSGVLVGTLAAGSAAGVTIANATINGNNSFGISAAGAVASIRVENSTIAGNSTGIGTSSGAIIASYGNNTLIGNGVNGSFNGFPAEN